MLAMVGVLFFQPSLGRAQAADYSFVPMVYVGALIVNGGASLANGLALSRDVPDRRNGQFGVVFGVASMVFAGALYTLDPDHEYSEEAVLMLGGAGLVSAVTGGLTIRE